MSVVALLAVVYGLKQIAQDGVSVVPAVAGGLGVGALWVRRQRQLADPGSTSTCSGSGPSTPPSSSTSWRSS
ncbi:hypothetical protein [Pseudonocardia sp.]|uniref:hypothetical protein n=1 Tax=Pseudonocardia sp. TaxID=60912 RepID=UPI0031FE2E31